jgi:hypothetical protein
MPFCWTDPSTCSTLHWKLGGSGETGEVFSLINMKIQRVILFHPINTFVGTLTKGGGEKKKKKTRF